METTFIHPRFKLRPQSDIRDDIRISIFINHINLQKSLSKIVFRWDARSPILSATEDNIDNSL